MRKLFLLCGAAIGVMGLFPAVSNAQVSGEGNITYENFLLTALAQAHLNGSLTGLVGFVGLEGVVDVDSAATAIIDSKQILNGNTVNFKEEAFREGRSGGVDPAVWGYQVDDASADDTDEIPIGYFAPIVNTIAPFSVSGNGNVGLNMAAGYSNAQDNSAAIASSSFTAADDDEEAGWSEASLLSLQYSQDNTYGPYEAPQRSPDDDALEGPAYDDFRVRNSVTVTTISGSGNIGVNAAAGAFNIQQNAMVLAVTEDSALAAATAGVIQTGLGNTTTEMNAVNYVSGGSISGSGNIGVNLASGVGNMQHNSLTVAASGG